MKNRQCCIDLNTVDLGYMIDWLMLIELILRRFGVGYSEFSLSFPLCLSLDPSPPCRSGSLSLQGTRERVTDGDECAREREDPGIHQWRMKGGVNSFLLSSLSAPVLFDQNFFPKTIAWSNLNPNHISTTTSTAKQKKGWVRRGGKGPRHHHVRYQTSDLYQRLPPQRKKQVLGRKSTRSSMGYI